MVWKNISTWIHSSGGTGAVKYDRTLQLGEDCIDETSWLHETEETDSTEATSDYSDLNESRPLTSCSAPFLRPVIHGEAALCEAIISCQCSEECQSHLGVEEIGTDEEKPTNLWEEEEDYIFSNSVENSTCSLSPKFKSCENVADIVVSSDNLDLTGINCRSITSSNHSNTSPLFVSEGIKTSTLRCQCVERSDLPPAVNKLETSNCIDFTTVKPVETLISCSDHCAVPYSPDMSKMSRKISTMRNFNKIEQGKSENILSNSLGCYASCGNLDHTLINETEISNEIIEADEESNESSKRIRDIGISSQGISSQGISSQGISSHRCLPLNEPARHCSTVIHPEGGCHLVGASQDMEAEDNQSFVTAQLQQLSVNTVSELPLQQHSHLVDQYESSQISEKCNNVSDSKICKHVHVSKIVSGNSDYSTHKASNKNKTFINKNCSAERKHKQSVGKSDLKEFAAAEESSYRQTTENKDCLLACEEAHCRKISYKQHHNSNTDQIDNEMLDGNTVPCSWVNPGDCQIHEEDFLPTHYQTDVMAGQVFAVSQYGTRDSQASGWSSEDSFDDAVSNTASLSSQIPSSETFTTIQNTLTQAVSLSSDDQEMTSTCSSVASSHPSEENHEGIFCTDGQTFTPVVARQPTVVTCMPAGCSFPYVTDLNRSMYVLGRPAVMSSSSVHFAKHPSGATIMQRQSMSAGLGGCMAHASAMKHQAIPNGVQATAVLQHHTLTNRGQTMLVQQRTMMTGLGGRAQQTVIQQQVAAPVAMTQATMMHMRQRALTPQQASLIQQRGIRYVPAGVLGSPLLQSQTVRSTAVIEGRAATLVGQGLVSGVNQSHVMQHLVQQRYLGGPIMPGRGIQLVAGRPVRLVNR